MKWKRGTYQKKFYPRILSSEFELVTAKGVILEGLFGIETGTNTITHIQSGTLVATLTNSKKAKKLCSLLVECKLLDSVLTELDITQEIANKFFQLKNQVAENAK
jgi:hypothetical protein